MLKRNVIPTFFILTFGITWVMWISAILTKLNGSVSILGPDNPVGQFGRWAPGIVAIILTIFLTGKQGVSVLFRPLKIVRVHFGWYLFALFFQPILFYISRLIDTLFGNTYKVTSPLTNVSIEAPFVFIILGVIISAIPGAFMEELGWRGFALPRLQIRNNALFSSIILGLIWGVWHIPSKIYFGETNALIIFQSVLNFIPVTILFTWIFNNTKGSLLLVTLYHASVQYTNNFLGVIPTQTANYLIWLIAAIVIAVTGTINLSKSNERMQSE